MNVRVGIGVAVFKDGKILLGKRKNAHGEGYWAYPGGHLEFNETPESCAEREVMEETGLTVTNLRRGPVTNDIFNSENKHYVTLFVLADYHSGDLVNKEPHKCEEWKWFNWADLPSPLFLPIENKIKQGFHPSKY